MRVLIVEDNAKLAGLLRDALHQEGYAVDVAHDGPTALTCTEAASYDAVVLDWMLPGIDGMTVLERLRARGSSTPVLLLTARSEVPDRVAGLDRGADAYMVKPFAMDELMARLRALVRRTNAVATSLVEVADLRIDTATRTVRRAGRWIELTQREYAILECLALRQGRVVSREVLRESIYNLEADTESNVIDVYVGHLRRKIDRSFDQKLLHTRRGKGYCLGEGP